MLSIQPKWVEKIASGEKTIEVRKTAPKEVPFKAYIYETYDKKYADIGICWRNGKTFEHGCKKVIGEFVCDKVDDFYCASVPYRRENNLGYGQFIDNGVYKVNGWHEGIVFERNDRFIDSMLNNNDLKEMCLSVQELFDYIGIGKHLYGWRISDLKIYDKPKELSEFKKTKGRIARTCGMQARNGLCCAIDHEELCDNLKCCFKRPCPPQSWCYVEEL